MSNKKEGFCRLMDRKVIGDEMVHGRKEWIKFLNCSLDAVVSKKGFSQDLV